MEYDKIGREIAIMKIKLKGKRVTLNNIEVKDIFNEILQKKIVLICLFLVAVVALAWISYGKAIDYYFWRDDTKVVWMQRYMPAAINNIKAHSVGRGRIGAMIFDYLEYTFLGYDSASHQQFGFVLRVVNIFLIYFFAKQLTKSSRVAVVSSLFAASFIGGLEAYSWVRGIGMMITLALLSFGFYIKSYYSQKKRYFILSLIFAMMSLSMDMWRSLGIIILIALWESLQIISKSPHRKRSSSVVRIVTYLAAQVIVIKGVLSSSTSAGGGGIGGSAFGYVKGAIEGGALDHFFSSLGNMLRIPFFFAFEEGGLADGDMISIYFGVGTIFLLIFFTIVFLKSRDNKYIPWIVLLVWIPLCYGPNWLYAQTTELGSTHRYLAFSAVAVPILWSKISVTKLPARFGAVVILFFITLSLNHAQIIAEKDYLIRGKSFVLPYWQQIVKRIDVGETNSFIYMSGNNRVIGYVFAWSDIFPLATLKGIKNVRQFPLYVTPKEAAEVLCDPETLIHDPITGGKRRAGTDYAISKSYAWFINDFELMEERSDKFRTDIARQADCLWNPQAVQFFGGLRLTGTTTVPLDQDTKKLGILTKWSSNTKSSEPYHYIGKAYSKDGNLINLFVGNISFEQDSAGFSVVTIPLPKEPPTRIDIQIEGDTRVRSINL